MSRRCWGIDVSHWNGGIKWGTVAGNGATFAFAKATEGVGYRDPTFQRNYDGIRDAQMYRGAYHFARVSKSPDLQSDARREADWFLKVTGDDRRMTLPPVLDLEWDKKAKGIPPEGIIDWALTWLEHVEEATNHTPILYTGFNYWRWKLGRTAVFRRYPLWMVQYKSRWHKGKKVPKNPIVGHPWTFWQFSSKGRVSGVESKHCDVNSFAGQISNLCVLASGRQVSSVAEPRREYSFSTPTWWTRTACWAVDSLSNRSV